MRGGRCGLPRSSGGWRAADAGGVEEAFDAAEAHAVGSGERGGGGAVAIGGDQFGDVTLVEALAQAPRTFRARSRGAHGAGERYGVAKLQVSGLCRVRVRGKYLHGGCSSRLSWAFMLSRCASPSSFVKEIATIRIPLAPYEQTTSSVADERALRIGRPARREDRTRQRFGTPGGSRATRRLGPPTIRLCKPPATGKIQSRHGSSPSSVANSCQAEPALRCSACSLTVQPRTVYPIRFHTQIPKGPPHPTSIGSAGSVTGSDSSF
jgi:hypothetical protein